MDESLDSVLEKCLSSCGALSPHDALTVALHACLLAEGYVCVAAGDENFGEGMSQSSPSRSASPYSLPVGWNSSQEVCSLQYFHQRSRQLFLVKTLVIGGELLISAMVASNMTEVYTTTLETERYLRMQQFTTVSAFSNLLQLISTLNKDIVSKLLQLATATTTSSQHTSSSTSSSTPSSSSSSSSSSTATQKTGSSGRVNTGPDYDPLRVAPSRYPGGVLRDPVRVSGPFGYGDPDRLPFSSGGGGGRGGGGMFFDPLRPSPMSTGQPFPPFPPSHPAGARFDPVTPFGGVQPFPTRGGSGGRSGRYFGEPDPDHLPPPGSDDMFS